DVLLSARRVGPTGKAYGLDMTDEMLTLARENQRKAGVENVEFLKGEIENIPLPDNSVELPRQQAIRLRDSAHSTVAGHLLFTLLAEGFWSALTVRALTGMGFVSRVTPVQTALRNCIGDEGGPFGFGDQVADPKPPQAAAVKSRGGERCGKVGTRSRQVWSREASASEPSMKCRKLLR